MANHTRGRLWLQILIILSALLVFAGMGCGGTQNREPDGSGGAMNSENGGLDTSGMANEVTSTPENTEAEATTGVTYAPENTEADAATELTPEVIDKPIELTGGPLYGAADDAAQDQYGAAQDQYGAAQDQYGELDQLSEFNAAGAGTAPPTVAEYQGSLEEFVTLIANDVAYKWNQRFADFGYYYQTPRLQFVYDQPVHVGEGCGNVSGDTFDPNVGNFSALYCPFDQTVYYVVHWKIKAGDGNYYELHQWGDFAVAYIVGHELAHHVQNQLGALKWKSEGMTNEEVLSRTRQIEAQADCLAGNWATTIYAEGRLEQGDIEEAIALAQSIGPDVVRPDLDPSLYTHPPSYQRREQFTTGFLTGDPNACTL